MMTQNEFVIRVNSMPWVNRASSFDGMDCYGLVMLYYKHVLGIELPCPKGYLDREKIADCWVSETSSGRWERVNRPCSDGIVFTSYIGEFPMHVGIMLDNKRAIHCRGSEENPGKVEIHNIAAIQSVYGKTTFHRYIGD